MTRRKAIFLACAVIAGCIGYYFYDLIAQDSLRHRNYFARYVVDANESAVVFGIHDEEDHGAIVWYERSTGMTRYFTAAPDSLRGPRLEKDGTLTLAIRPSEAKGISAILSCTITPLNCRRVFETEMGISSPIALGDGRYLAAMSPYRDGLAKNKYAQNEIFLVIPGRVAHPLTSFSAYGLGSIGRTGNRIFFSALGANGWPSLGALEPNNEVFTGEWSGDENAIINIVKFKPFDELTIVPGTSNPSIAPDGSILVAQTGYERDGVIVIHDFKSGSNILHNLPPDRRANAIAVSGHRLTWIETDADRFRIIDFDVRNSTRHVSAEFAGSSFRKNPERISIR
jgi:hypothetical protein